MASEILETWRVTAYDASADIDELLRQFQRACEDVVVRGDSNISETTKLRAILRNDLRARLLAAPSSSEPVSAPSEDAPWSDEVTRAHSHLLDLVLSHRYSGHTLRPVCCAPSRRSDRVTQPSTDEVGRG